MVKLAYVRPEVAKTISERSVSKVTKSEITLIGLEVSATLCSQGDIEVTSGPVKGRADGKGHRLAGAQAELSFPPGSMAVSSPGAISGSTGGHRPGLHLGNSSQFNTVWCIYPCHTAVTILHRPPALSQHGVTPGATVSAPVPTSQKLRNLLLASPSLSDRENGNKCSNFVLYRPSFIQLNIRFFIKVVAVSQTQPRYLRNSRAHQALETSLKYP